RSRRAGRGAARHGGPPRPAPGGRPPQPPARRSRRRRGGLPDVPSRARAALPAPARGHPRRGRPLDRLAEAGLRRPDGHHGERRPRDRARGGPGRQQGLRDRRHLVRPAAGRAPGGPAVSAPRRAPVVVFDVNETLLDLGALRPAIGAALGDAGALEAWFGRVIRTAMTLTAVGGWADFAAVADAALVVEGAARGAAPDAH